MVKKYVRGSSTNPKGAIKALENLGGVNTHHYAGDIPTSVYYSSSIYELYKDVEHQTFWCCHNSPFGGIVGEIDAGHPVQNAND